jgi:hypothetical protein
MKLNGDGITGLTSNSAPGSKNNVRESKEGMPRPRERKVEFSMPRQLCDVQRHAENEKSNYARRDMNKLRHVHIQLYCSTYWVVFVSF